MKSKNSKHSKGDTCITTVVGTTSNEAHEHLCLLTDEIKYYAGKLILIKPVQLKKGYAFKVVFKIPSDIREAFGVEKVYGKMCRIEAKAFITKRRFNTIGGVINA